MTGKAASVVIMRPARGDSVMSDLQVRRIPFAFEGVDFIWNPGNPAFAVQMNIISFMVIGLEKYFCRAVADAEARIRDPAILEEARLFRIQEAVHSQAHKLHVSALIKKYPGLKACLLYTSPSPRDRQKSRMPSSA